MLLKVNCDRGFGDERKSSFNLRRVPLKELHNHN